MAKEPAIRSLTIQNLLSFGPEPTTVELRNLNVLIGPNGSGKSNLIEVLGLLHSAPDELTKAITRGGPIDEWLWKGGAKTRTTPTASICVVMNPIPGRKAELVYRLEFTRAAGYRFEITDERVENRLPLGKPSSHVYYQRPNGSSKPNGRPGASTHRRASLDPRVSVLRLRNDPESQPATAHVGDVFSQLRLYSDWQFGALSPVREPCDASLQNQYLEEDFSNLGVVLDRLLAVPSVKDRILTSLQTFCEDTKDLRTNIEGGRVQIRLFEKHLKAGVPLVRMSDGTLRWLTLLAILLNPDPPPLVCIEEPELGLHPDMIHELAELLIEASTRMQLIITTHSDRLVEEFSDTPEAVVVCEKESGVSQFRRLDAGKLSTWLEEYTLGQLWTKGQIGGTRW